VQKALAISTFYDFKRATNAVFVIQIKSKNKKIK